MGILDTLDVPRRMAWRLFTGLRDHATIGDWRHPRLHQIGPAVARGEGYDLDVILMHGLGGHPTDTWISKDGGFWPTAFVETVEKELNCSIRLLSLEYESSIGTLKRVSSDDIARIGAAASRLLMSYRIGERNTVFVCHSMGGLVLKALLRHAASGKDRPNKEAPDLCSQVSGVLFLGTPHAGSKLALIGSYINRLIGFEVCSKLVEGLARDFGDGAVSKLQEDFIDVARNRPWLRICSVFENTKIPGIDALIVDKESGKGDWTNLEPKQYNILEADVDHFGIACPSPDSTGYWWITDPLRDLIGRASRVRSRPERDVPQLVVSDNDDSENRLKEAVQDALREETSALRKSKPWFRSGWTWTGLGIAALALTGAVILSQGSDVDPTPPRPTTAPMGTAGGNCYPNGTCDPGLDCIDTKCMPERPTMGTKGGNCYPNGTCNPKLDCVDSICTPERTAMGMEGGNCFPDRTCRPGLQCRSSAENGGRATCTPVITDSTPVPTGGSDTVTQANADIGDRPRDADAQTENGGSGLDSSPGRDGGILQVVADGASVCTCTQPRTVCVGGRCVDSLRVFVSSKRYTGDLVLRR